MGVGIRDHLLGFERRKMSILIKGMEMPICRTCPCGEEKLYGNLCHITNEIVPFSFDRGDKCPLIELPPHGDLIDRDRLTDTIDGITWYHQNRNKDIVEGANSAEHQAWYREQDVHEAVADAPVVIESEE